MLHIRPSLGQYYQPQPVAIDPLVHAGLQAAGQVLATSDPGAPQTMMLIERLIAAPGLPGGSPKISKLSDVNPLLEVAVFWREHPFVTIGAVLAVPLFAYLFGRQAGMRR